MNGGEGRNCDEDEPQASQNEMPDCATHETRGKHEREFGLRRTMGNLRATDKVGVRPERI
jgi:hypothetical protein